MSKVLVVYDSYSGNVEKLAKAIAEKTEGSLVKLETSHRYPKEYKAVVDQVMQEIKVDFRPPVLNEIADWELYDEVFVGTPNWWSCPTPLMMHFLESMDFRGKRVYPFSTHGGGGCGYVAQMIAKAVAPATTSSLFHCYQGDWNEEKLSLWIEMGRKR